MSKKTRGNLYAALRRDFGTPALDYLEEQFRDLPIKEWRRSLNTLFDGGDPVVAKSTRDAQKALPKEERTITRKPSPPTRRAGQSAGEAAAEQVVRRKVPAQARAPEVRVQPSLAVDVDPRLADRKGELVDAIPNLSVGLSKSRIGDIPGVSIFDYEGHPIITSMADQSAAGDDITHINDIELPWAVQRLGGQDFMHDPLNEGTVWANDLAMVTKHMDLARHLKSLTGKDPLFAPFTMAPTGVDFGHMPRETMLAYEAATRSQPAKNALDKELRAIVGDDYRSMDDPASVEAFRNVATPAQRGALNHLLNQQWRTGGLGYGPARLASQDLGQMGTPLLDMRNLGVIHADREPTRTIHPSFPVGIPGEPLGRLDHPLAALSVLPDLRREKEILDPREFPVGVEAGSPSPMRTLQMGPRGSVLDYHDFNGIRQRGYACGGPVRSLAVM